MLTKAYVEITNICNLKCSFCPGTKRKKEYISLEKFEVILKKLQGKIEYLYLHLMGEPLLHPNFKDILSVCEKYGFKVIITTNGTLLNTQNAKEILASKAIYKVSVSVHSFEANTEKITIDEYLNSVFNFLKLSSKNGILSVMRLWNLDGENTTGLNELNEYILSKMHEAFSDDWVKVRSGFRLQDKTYLEWGEKFDWPDSTIEDIGSFGYCYGVHSQIGVLVDGTVVPCCLDHDGEIPLGNLLTQEFDDIMSSERAVNIREGFFNRKLIEPLCKKCGYSRRF